MEQSYQKEIDEINKEIKDQLLELQKLTEEYLSLNYSMFKRQLQFDINHLAEKHLRTAKYAVTIERSAANFYEFSEKRSNPVINIAYQKLQQSHIIKACEAEDYRSKIQVVVDGKLIEAWI